MLEKRHGAKRMSEYWARNESVRAQAQAHDDAACDGRFELIYKFDHNVLSGDDLTLSGQQIDVPGFTSGIDLNLKSPFTEWL
jgi:acetoacetyl-[acyl-carrier protein] synthase